LPEDRDANGVVEAKLKALLASIEDEFQEASHKLAEIVYADTQQQEPGGDPEAEDNGTKSKKSDAVDADFEVVAD
jgi:molecular chaperone DnaK